MFPPNIVSHLARSYASNIIESARVTVCYFYYHVGMVRSSCSSLSNKERELKESDQSLYAESRKFQQSRLIDECTYLCFNNII